VILVVGPEARPVLVKRARVFVSTGLRV